MPAVLFVCTANVCRSPLASALFQGMVAQRADSADWRVESAGVWAMDGSPAAQGSQAVVKTRGLDLSAHRARGVSRELLSQFDVVLTMEHGHKEGLRAEFPDLARRVYLISEMIERRTDIRDPMGGMPADYEDTARELEQILRQGMDKIISLAAATGAAGQVLSK